LDISNIGSLYIGFDGVSSYHNSYIYQDYVYNYARSSSQILADYNAKIETVISETFTYTSLLEMARNWNTVSGVYTIADNVLTATTGGDLTTSVSLPYADNGYVTYDLYSGSWGSVAETIDASSVFAYSNNLLTMTLATNEKIRNIVIKTGN